MHGGGDKKLPLLFLLEEENPTRSVLKRVMKEKKRVGGRSIKISEQSPRLLDLGIRF